MLIVKHPECLPSTHIAEMLSIVMPVLKAMAVPHCLIGAQALALIVHGVYGTKVSRISGDVDMAIALQGWPEFEKLKQQLVHTGHFNVSAKAAHKLWFHSPTSGVELPIDLVPFGGVEMKENAGTIAWPPDDAFQMSVAGLAEAVNNAITIQIIDNVNVRVCSLPSFALLKLLAWQDRHKLMNKDAADLSFVANHAEKTGLFDRIYDDENEDLLTISGYDPRQACARLLARDMATQMTPLSWSALRDFCQPNKLQQRLLDQLRGPQPALSAFLSQLQEEPAKHRPLK